MAAPTTPPTARRLLLGIKLRQLRVAAGYTPTDVYKATGISRATLHRQETAEQSPQPRTLKTLLTLYNVGQREAAELTRLAKESDQQPWLQSFGDLPSPYLTLISFEREAKSLRTFEASLVPGLLQTPDYALEATRSVWPDATEAQLRQRVEVRIQRQEALRLAGTGLHAIIDEAALRRRVGSAQHMRDQIDHLLEAASRPQVTLQVLGSGTGAHPAIHGAFMILNFGAPFETDIVYLEGLVTDLFLTESGEVRRYAEAFTAVQDLALPPAETPAYLARLRGQA
ncbi:helix-turn-helix transcriptional regulator [Actinomadura sp. NPDC023710]|uniref:helix-turn-helix domain-containing protein n=1 Tax=Actinomadura sp. NPDC023710 TaxID=3158219 RepID=UPI0033DEE3F8